MKTAEKLILGALAALFFVGACIVGLGIVTLGRSDRAIATLSELRAEAQAIRAQGEARYEYKALSFLGDEARERTGPEAGRFVTITPTEEELALIGQNGWEIVTSYLETETAWPNFGNDRYVTGIQTNVRPQRLVMIVRRRLAEPARAPGAGRAR